MPHSPITRVLGILIAAGFAGFLLWPSAEAHQWGKLALAALPVVTAIFTWTAVASAAPFDDQAFHRTLPPSDSDAFRRVLTMHLLVLAGLAIVIGLYCLRVNFGWREFTWGIALIIIPLWAWMALTGVAFSLMTSRQHWKSIGPLVVFAIPLISYSLRYWFMERSHPSRHAYEATVITAAVAYPIVWWIASVKRRRRLALTTVGAVGAVLPWLFAYAQMQPELREERYVLERLPDAQVSLKRMVVPVEELRRQSWLPLEQVISIEGLDEGEFLALHGFLRPSGGPLPEELFRSGPVDPNASREKYPLPATVRRTSGGELKWGEEAVWEALWERIPPHHEFIHWQAALEEGGRDVYLNPISLAVQSLLPEPAVEPMRALADMEREVLEQLNELPWRTVTSHPQRLEKVGVIEASTGGSCRLPEGGLLSIEPETTESGAFALDVSTWSPSNTEPWTGRSGNGVSAHRSWIIALHPDGTAWAISGRELQRTQKSQPVFLGRVDHAVLEAKEVAHAGRTAALHECQLHVFWPVTIGLLRDPIPPPK